MVIRMDTTIQEMDYNTLLMNHLNRLSAVTTSSFIDVVTKEQKEISEQIGYRPTNIGETALKWGVNFLYSIVPSQLIDQQARKEYDEKWEENKKTMKDNKMKDFPIVFQFDKIRVMVNLLDRKGFLRPQRNPAGFKSKKKEIAPSQEFEK
jgi:hypothetical protein